MKSLFDNLKAIVPFYDAIVAVEGQRGGRTLRTGALPACVIDQGLDDQISDGAISSTRRLYRVSILKEDLKDSKGEIIKIGWPDTSRPQINDVITLADGTRLSVESVSEDTREYHMEARSC